MMEILSYTESMEVSVILFLFGSLLTIIGFLINNSIGNLNSKIDNLNNYIKEHDIKLDLAEKKRRDLQDQINEKIHKLINEEVMPLYLRLQRIEDKIGE